MTQASGPSNVFIAAPAAGLMPQAVEPSRVTHQLVGRHHALPKVRGQRLRRKVQRVEWLVRHRRPYSVQPAALVATAGPAAAACHELARAAARTAASNGICLKGLASCAHGVPSMFSKMRQLTPSEL